VVGEREERVKRDKKAVEAKAEAEAIVEVEKGEIIELPERSKTVVVESEGKEEEEKEMKNQKTLTDFF
jgi:hypothetical protein